MWTALLTLILLILIVLAIIILVLGGVSKHVDVATIGHWGTDERVVATALGAASYETPTITALQNLIRKRSGMIVGAFSSSMLLGVLPFLDTHPSTTLISTASTLSSSALDNAPGIVRLVASDDRTKPQLQQALRAALPNGGTVSVYAQAGNAWANGMVEAITSSAEELDGFTVSPVADLTTVPSNASTQPSSATLLAVYTEDDADMTELARLSGYTILLGDVSTNTRPTCASTNRVLATVSEVATPRDVALASSFAEHDVNPFVSALVFAVPLVREATDREWLLARLEAMGLFKDGLATGTTMSVQRLFPPETSTSSLSTVTGTSELLMTAYPPPPLSECMQCLSNTGSPSAPILLAPTQEVVNWGGAYNGHHTAAVVLNQFLQLSTEDDGNGMYRIVLTSQDADSGADQGQLHIESGVPSSNSILELRLVELRTQMLMDMYVAILWQGQPNGGATIVKGVALSGLDILDLRQSLTRTRVGMPISE